MRKYILPIAMGVSVLSLAQVKIGFDDNNATSALLSVGQNNTGIDTPADNTLQVKNNNHSAITILPNGNVGFNVTNPTHQLHVDFDNSFLKIDNLPNNGNAGDPYLVIDEQGEVKHRAATSVNIDGQVLRLGVQGFLDNDISAEQPLRLVDSSTMGSSINNTSTLPNFLNTIDGAQISYNQALGADAGSPARTTDRIQLPAGVYNVMVRILGNWNNDGNNDPSNNALNIKMIVNNKEYSYANGVIDRNDTTIKLGFFNETLVLDQTSWIDFTYEQTLSDNGLNIYEKAQDGSNTFTESAVLIQRLR